MTVDAMTPRNRFIGALRGNPVDRAPAANPTSIVTLELQRKVGVFFPDAHCHAQAMAELALAGHTVCGYDVVAPAFGAGTQESAALGVPVRWGDETCMPSQEQHIWSHPDEIRIPDDFLERPSVRSVIDAIALLRRELGDKVGIVGKVYGPWSLAYHTFGLAPFLKDTIKDPAKVDAILERLEEVTVRYAAAQVEAGADALCLGDHITANLIRPDAYPRFLLGIHRRLGEAIDAPLIFHCCGRTMDRIGHFNDNSLAAFHFESANDAAEMRAAANMVLVGNVNNTRTLVEGTPDDVRREVFQALDAGIDMIAPECAVPVTARLENVAAIPAAIEEYHAMR
jgi:[methyl-Co(III) methanol-specific corrinoid protein]:coenzyme M methyltransferase